VASMGPARPGRSADASDDRGAASHHPRLNEHSASLPIDDSVADHRNQLTIATGDGVPAWQRRGPNCGGVARRHRWKRLLPAKYAGGGSRRCSGLLR